MKTICTNHRNINLFILMILFSFFSCYISYAQNVGIGVADPSAALHLKAGGMVSGSAPLKFTTQPAGLTTVEQGAMELIGNSLQFTQLHKRRAVAMSQSVLLTDIAIGPNSTSETTLITAEHGANYLEPGKMEEIVLRGLVQQSSTGRLQIRVYYAGQLVQMVQTPNSSSFVTTPIEIRVSSTCRTAGTTGTMQFNNVVWIDGQSNALDGIILPTVNTTTAQNTTITAQWTSSQATNILTINQGRVLCIDGNK